MACQVEMDCRALIGAKKIAMRIDGAELYTDHRAWLFHFCFLLSQFLLCGVISAFQRLFQDQL